MPRLVLWTDYTEGQWFCAVNVASFWGNVWEINLNSMATTLSVHFLGLSGISDWKLGKQWGKEENWTAIECMTTKI